jgi:kynurenine formamidase
LQSTRSSCRSFLDIRENCTYHPERRRGAIEGEEPSLKQHVRIIDLSLPLENYATEPYPPTITYFDHRAGARRLGGLANVDPHDFPQGLALASEMITTGAHSGTHVDAPWHYGPESEGRAARTIDEVPLEWLYGPGVVLDMVHKEPGSEITADDVRDALDRIDHELKPEDKVLIRTGADRYWGSSSYLPMQSGLGVEATAFILERGVKAIGIDAWGLDRPVTKMAEAYAKGDKTALWPSHFYGRTKEYVQVEKLANLDQIPAPVGFTFSALPVKIDRASGGWCRAVAIVEQEVE